MSRGPPGGVEGEADGSEGVSCGGVTLVAEMSRRPKSVSFPQAVCDSGRA